MFIKSFLQQKPLKEKMSTAVSKTERQAKNAVISFSSLHEKYFSSNFKETISNTTMKYKFVQFKSGISSRFNFGLATGQFNSTEKVLAYFNLEFGKFRFGSAEWIDCYFIVTYV